MSCFLVQRCTDYSTKNCPPSTYCDEVGGMKVCVPLAGKPCSLTASDTVCHQSNIPMSFTCVRDGVGDGVCLPVNDVGESCSDTSDCCKYHKQLGFSFTSLLWYYQIIIGASKHFPCICL